MNSLFQARDYRDYPDRFVPLAYDSIIPLDDGQHRFKLEVIPADGSRILAAREYYAAVSTLVPNSYIYGISAIGDYKVQIRDVGTGQKWFSSPINVADLLPQNANLYTFQPLAKRRLISPPGRIEVQIWSQSTSDQLAILVLFMAEPVVQGDPNV